MTEVVPDWAKEEAPTWAAEPATPVEKPAENEARRTGIKPVAALRSAHSMPAENLMEPRMSGPSFGEIGTGLAETGANAVVGMLTQPVAGLRGIGSMVADLPAIVQGRKTFDQAADEAANGVRKVETAGANIVPQNAVAQGVQGAIAKPFEMASHGLGTVGGAIGEAVGGAKGRAAGETLGENAISLAGAMIPAVGTVRKLARGAKGMPIVPLDQKTAALKEAQDNGFLLAPAKANPGVVNSVVEGAADSDKLHDRLAMKNAGHTDALTREEIGRKAGDDLDRKVLSDYRHAQAQAYDAVKAVPGDVPIDKQFISDIDKITKEFESVKETTPGLYKHQELELIKSELLNPAKPYTAKSITEIAQALRSKATKDLAGINLTAEQVDAAMARKAASEHLEQLLERNLDAQGLKDLSTGFTTARTKIAKAHNIEDALNDVTGEVDPQKLRAMYDKGVPLSGNLLKIARAAKASPETMRPNVNLKGDLSPHLGDWGAAGAFSLALSNPWALTAAAVRPLSRGVASTQAYQRVMGRVAPAAPQRPALRATSTLPGAVTGAGNTSSTLPPPMEPQK